MDFDVNHRLTKKIEAFFFADLLGLLGGLLLSLGGLDLGLGLQLGLVHRELDGLRRRLRPEVVHPGLEALPESRREGGVSQHVEESISVTGQIRRLTLTERSKNPLKNETGTSE